MIYGEQGEEVAADTKETASFVQGVVFFAFTRTNYVLPRVGQSNHSD